VPKPWKIEALYPAKTARMEALAIIDPLSESSPSIAQLLYTLHTDLKANVTVAFNPNGVERLNSRNPHLENIKTLLDLTKWSKTSMWGEPVTFDNIVTSEKMRADLKVPNHWELSLKSAEPLGADLDNLSAEEVNGKNVTVNAEYELTAIWHQGEVTHFFFTIGLKMKQKNQKNP